MMKSSIYGYHGDVKSPYIRVTVKDPRDISKSKAKIEQGVFVAGLGRPCQADTTFESNLAYILRFMIDCKVPGSNWIELPAETWSFIEKPTSLAQIEVQTRYLLKVVYGKKFC
jgi:DNA polymerase delta subunit 1